MRNRTRPAMRRTSWPIASSIPAPRWGRVVLGKPVGPCSAAISSSAGRPQIAWAASIPDVTAPSTQPASKPLRVQSPANTRLEKQRSFGHRRSSTESARVST